MRRKKNILSLCISCVVNAEVGFFLKYYLSPPLFKSNFTEFYIYGPDSNLNNV